MGWETLSLSVRPAATVHNYQDDSRESPARTWHARPFPGARPTSLLGPSELKGGYEKQDC